MQNAKLALSRRKSCQAGFTLPELLVAVLIFGVVSAATFSLMSIHVPLFNQQQNQAGLNIAMRNAVGQIQTDLVNGGAGYYSTAGLNIPNWPVGVVIINNVVSSSGNCATGIVYGANCFDSFTSIVSDPNTPAMNPSIDPVVANGDLSCGSISTDATNTRTDSGVMYLIPPSGDTSAQITSLAGQFYTGDEVLLVSNSGSQYTAVALTANGTTKTVSGKTYIQLNHGTTTTTSETIAGVVTTIYGYNSSSSNDPANMTTNANASLGEAYCSTDWVIRLTPIKYDVDITTNASNPTLRRTLLVQGNTPAANGVPLMNQVIGFKVGATLLSGASTTYVFDSSTFGATPPGYDFTQVRSVMVSMIGRTTPNPDPTYVFRNSFDGGPYQIQGVSVVVNPRNMSM